MRRLLIGFVLLSGCHGFSPPCMKAAKAVCDIPSEGDACAFLLNADRANEPLQAVCKNIAPTAVALGKDPTSEPAKESWKAARLQLARFGLITDEKRGQIADKLKRANGIGGKLVDSLEKNTALDEKETAERAQRALDGENH